MNWVISNTEVSNDSVRDLRLAEIERFAANDQEYKDLAVMIKEGFPNAKANMPDSLKVFWQAREHLHLDEEGLILYGERLFIPTKLRTTILDRLLAMHQAADKMLARARQCIWWSFLTNDIRTAAAKCGPCQESKPSLPREPLRHHKLPEFPFQYLHTDLAMYEGHQFLITVDQYSGFPHVFEMGRNAPTSKVIEKLTQVFTDFSVPMVIYSDGGPQFTSDEFAQFCAKWGVQHVDSSPYYPQSNGIAEGAVKEMKKIIRGTFVHSSGKLDKSSAAAGVLLFRNTPRTPTDLSPAQLLFGRSMRDNLPMSRQNLKPHLWYEAAKRRQEALRTRDGTCKGRSLPMLQPGARVFIQNPQTKRWDQSGSIVSFGRNEREYVVRFDKTGREGRRNRRFLRVQIVAPEAPPRQPVEPPKPDETEEMEKTESTPRVGNLKPEDRRRSDRNVAQRPKRSIRRPVRFDDQYLY
jgi:hypothetical protein